MKLTKTEISQKQAQLVDTLLKIDKPKADKASLEKALAADFKVNEMKYRDGVKTPNGVLIRKQNWKCVAKPVVEAA